MQNMHANEFCKNHTSDIASSDKRTTWVTAYTKLDYVLATKALLRGLSFFSSTSCATPCRQMQLPTGSENTVKLLPSEVTQMR